MATEPSKGAGGADEASRASKPSKDGKDECWEYGPAEWRHCAGTAMGHAGVSGLRISQWLGNSEAICRRHYIADVGATNWPLSWGNRE